MTSARIVVADDHVAVRGKIVHLLRREFEVLEDVNDGLALVEAVARLKPDLCVLDISMPIMNGIEAATRIKQGHLPPKLIFLSIHDDKDFVNEAFKTGAEGYVLKTRIATDLNLAVKEVLAGHTFISPVKSLQGEN